MSDKYILNINVDEQTDKNIDIFDETISIVVTPTTNIMDFLNDLQNEIISGEDDYKRKTFSSDNFSEFIVSFNIPISEISKDLFSQLHGKTSINCNNISYNDMQLLKDKLPDDFYAKHEYNFHDDVLFVDFLETLDMVNEIKKEIEHYNFSPLEKLLYLYDKVRKRIYKKSSPENKLSFSRDLTKIFNEKEIVCEGYANLLSSVANFLGIPTKVKKYLPSVINENCHGHATNLCYLNDNKYNIHGVFELDPTWDSKKNEQDREYINNYCFFGLSPFIAEKYKFNHYKLISDDSDDLKLLKKQYDRCLNAQKNFPPALCNIFYNTFLKRGIELFTKIGNTCKLEQLKKMSNNIDCDLNINEVWDMIISSFKYSISYTSFIKALYMVRRVEHSIDPVEYPLDMVSFKKAVDKKYSFKTVEQKLIYELVTREELLPIKTVILSLPVLSNIPSKNDKIYYDSKRMELLHALKTVSDGKNNSIKR